MAKVGGKEGGAVVAPHQPVVAHYKEVMEVGKRLVCQYPRIAVYKGSGNPEDPANFSCKMRGGKQDAGAL